MNLVKTTLWAGIGLAVLSGSALAAAVNCTVTPAHSIITEGQTLQLQASCDGSLSSVNWLMDGVSVTGSVALSNHAAGDPIYFTTPVGLGGSNTFLFTVAGDPASGTDTFGSSSTARVVVKPSSAVVARAATATTTPTTPTPASCGTANGATVSAMPTGTAQCATGSKPSLEISGPQSFSWSCVSLTGGADANCYALNSAAPAPAPTPDVINGVCGGANGLTLSSAPTNSLCSSGSASSVSPLTAFNTWTWSCIGSNGGSTANCSATKTASAPAPAPGPTPTDDPGIGTGLWVPADMTNRTVADQSGDGTMKVSYVPGCLNGLFASSSSVGCAGKTVFEGTTSSGAAHTVSFGGGNQLVLRYVSTPTAGSSVKVIRVRGYDGGNVGINMRVWLSTNPKATYNSVDARCKQTSNRLPYVATGGSYCPITPNTVYYFGIEYDESTASRYQVDELSADFL